MERPMRLQPLAFVSALSMVLVACVSPPAAYDHGSCRHDKWLFDEVTFEIAPVSSSMPSPRALDKFRLRLHQNNICDYKKIKFIVRKAAVRTAQAWNGFVLHSYELLRRARHDIDPEDRSLNVFVAYIDGPWIEAGRVRRLGGIQYGPSAFAVFKKGAGDRESSVLLHEFGHMIGLVKSSSAPNYDRQHKNHCAIQTCAMFHTAPGVDADYDLHCKKQIRSLIRVRSD
jgi:hypothetical protein